MWEYGVYGVELFVYNNTTLNFIFYGNRNNAVLMQTDEVFDKLLHNTIRNANTFTKKIKHLKN